MSAALYRLRDAEGALVYVAATLDVGARLAEHSATDDWWPHVTQIDVEVHPSMAAARAAEAKAVDTEHPHHHRARYGLPRDGDRYRAADLADLGHALRTTREDLYAAVATAIREDGISEVEAARRTGLDRSTIRTILGKARDRTAAPKH